MRFGKLPIEPKKKEAPILVSNRWRTDEQFLVKTFEFRRPDDREQFIDGLFRYEKDVGHNATITVTYDKVSIRLTTHDINQVSELDKEYARFADVLFRDTVYLDTDGT
jgi:pterin-4a-carbinolamine dehydratase